MRTFVLLVALAGSVRAEPILTVWTRGEATKNPIDLGRGELSEHSARDAQANETRTYRGVFLSNLIREVGPAGDLDLAVLHFKNGMAVPLPFRDGDVMKKLEPFIAIEMRTPNEQWTREFPPVAKRGAERRDTRPLRFTGVKLSVAVLAHPFLPPKASEEAVPWLYVDTLVGIEFVRSASLAAQFDMGEPVKQGQAVYLARCQYCHGVKGVGASWGWDFVEPVPVSKHRSAKSLWLHVKSREGDAPERGYMMPALRDVSEGEAGAVWKWIEAIAKKGPNPYARP